MRDPRADSPALAPLLAKGIAGAGLAGGACLAWGMVEAKLYRRRSHTIPVLPAGSRTIRVLQVSDLHLRPSSKALARFVDTLGDETYDLVLATGDLMGHPEVAEECARLLNGLRGSARCFVLGSSDYYAPKFKNYFDYVSGKSRPGARRNPTSDFTGRLVAEGWHDLTNRSIHLSLGGMATQITGLDDPHLKRDDRSLLVRDEGVDLALCVVHDPAPCWAAARGGFDLVVAGHTHGGQVRLPFVGALVTNSEVPRRLARWLSPLGGSWLFVNPGLGTGRYAPYRFLCPPEASVIDLVAGPVRIDAQRRPGSARASGG